MVLSQAYRCGSKLKVSFKSYCPTLFPIQALRRCRGIGAAGLALLWALGTALGRAAAGESGFTMRHLR